MSGEPPGSGRYKEWVEDRFPIRKYLRRSNSIQNLYQRRLLEDQESFLQDPPYVQERELQRNAKSNVDLRKEVFKWCFSRSCSKDHPKVPSTKSHPSPDDTKARYHLKRKTRPGAPKGQELRQTEILCHRCLGINIEDLPSESGYSDGGYYHSSLSELKKSAESCKLCGWISSVLPSKINDWTWERYGIFLVFGTKSPRVLKRRKTPHRTGSSLSQLWISARDMRPWEYPEDYKVRSRGEQYIREHVLRPEGAAPKEVSGRPLKCFTDEHDATKTTGMTWVRRIGRNTASATSFAVAKEWLSQCLSEDDLPKRSQPDEVYKECIPPEPFPTETPIRLVEISRDSGSNVALRLIGTEGHDFQYATLSYCSGTQNEEDRLSWVTTKSTLDHHLESIRLDHLPRTLREGISIAKELDLSYIWIDSLCIAQDSASELAREGAKIAGIFHGSVLTIVASVGATEHDGCFNTQSLSTVQAIDPNDLIILDGPLRDGSTSRLYIHQPSHCIDGIRNVDTYRDDVADSHWAQQAWKYQEEVFARRTLYYTSSQLYWSCKHGRRSEDNFPQDWARPYPIIDEGYPLSEAAVLKHWYKVAVEHYSRRRLMAGTEKLAAISALARATYLKRHTDYIAGLWRDSIIPGLKWRRQGPRGQKNKAYNCPSWSWASQDSIVSYQWAGEQRGEGLFMPQVLDVIWEPDSANMFGDVRSAHIVLDTTITTGGVMPDHFRRYEPFQHDAHYIQAVIISDPERAVLWHATATTDDAGVGGKMVAVAVLSTYYSERIFLLLDPPDLDAEEYRRVGIAIMGCSDGDNPKVQGDIASGWKRRTIKLV